MNNDRCELVLQMWDIAAEQCRAKLEEVPATKELRDLVYILEHLNNILPEQSNISECGEVLEVIWAEGNEAVWNE